MRDPGPPETADPPVPDENPRTTETGAAGGRRGWNLEDNCMFPTGATTARVAAVGDIHVGADNGRSVRRELEPAAGNADLLVIAGDLTQHGLDEEGRLAADCLRALGLPVVAVLGNHDYHQGAQDTIRRHLEGAQVCVLEGEAVVLDVGVLRVGIGGVKGFGGGFVGACGSEFGEDIMKQFMRHSRLCATRLGEQLRAMRCDVHLALTHYSPVPATLEGEPREIYPFLGSYFLGEAIDSGGCALAVHGHAHRGCEYGRTPGGVPVRNVARPVLGLAYKVYCLRAERQAAAPEATGASHAGSSESAGRPILLQSPGRP